MSTANQPLEKLIQITENYRVAVVIDEVQLSQRGVAHPQCVNKVVAPFVACSSGFPRLVKQGWSNRVGRYWSNRVGRYWRYGVSSRQPFDCTPFKLSSLRFFQKRVTVVAALRCIQNLDGSARWCGMRMRIVAKEGGESITYVVHVQVE